MIEEEEEKEAVMDVKGRGREAKEVARLRHPHY